MEKCYKEGSHRKQKIVIESGGIADELLSIKENKQVTPMINNKEKVHEKICLYSVKSVEQIIM